MEGISDWLESLGMSEYTDRFAEHKVDVSVLRHLTDQDLKDIGMPLGHRRKMLAAIAEINSPDLMPPPLPTTGPTAASEPSSVFTAFADLADLTTYVGNERQPRIENDQNARPLQATRRIRMLDWIYALKIVATVLLLCVIMLFILAGSPYGALVILLAIFTIPLCMIVNFMGYVFDPANDALRYPVFLIWCSIRLSQIKDVNAETITTSHTAEAGTLGNIDLGRLAGSSKIGPSRTVQRHRHLVTLSGDFGVRVMRFGARYKRDQFLSILRSQAPRIRITRALSIDG